MHGPISATFTIAVSNRCYLCFIDDEFEAEGQVGSKEADVQIQPVQPHISCVSLDILYNTKLTDTFMNFETIS